MSTTNDVTGPAAVAANGTAAGHRRDELERRRADLERELAAIRDELDALDRAERPPDPDELRAGRDFGWFDDQMNQGAFPPDWSGHYVLVFDKRVVAHGEDLGAVLDQAERETGLPKYRFAICCVD